jgi:hypothetical protein
MRLQRYPDGSNEWVLFIWGRHPKGSLTWTHSVTLSKQRPNTGQPKWGFFHIPGYQARYGMTLAGFTLQMITQERYP